VGCSSRNHGSQSLKTLHLLRHAKAVEDNLNGTDHARPLAKRGIAAAKALAQHLEDGGFAVDRVFCSTAKRTRETYELVAPALKGASIAYRDRLYLVAGGDLLDFIHGLPDMAESVMLIGHNPTFHNIALALAKNAARGHADELATLKEKFPTGALCSLNFDIAHWRQVKAGNGTLTAFIRPRDLEGE
jgi:phosphohistidine phosphatase